jgi:hypothetical protein
MLGNMPGSGASELPAGRYNPWGQKRMLEADEATVNRASKFAARQDLTPIERSAFWFHELTGAAGLEFVAFSNAMLDEPVELSGGVLLVPCFLPESEMSGANIGNLLVQLTMAMHREARFVFDGWLPVETWEEESVRNAIDNIHESFSLFSLTARVWFDWQPKYPAIDGTSPTYPIGDEQLAALASWAHQLDALPPEDRKALYRSLGWLSQGIRLTEPSARLLFSILAIESLATYVESDAPDDSRFAVLRGERLSKSETRKQREKCIEEVLAQTLGEDPTKAIQAAYFDCIQGVGSRLKDHLGRVFKQREALDVLFASTPGEMSLFDLRHRIAHGTADAISEAERYQIAQRVWEAERTARRYVASFVAASSGVKPPSAMVMSVEANLLNSVAVGGARYEGPTPMAQLYT